MLLLTTEGMEYVCEREEVQRMLLHMFMLLTWYNFSQDGSTAVHFMHCHVM